MERSRRSDNDRGHGETVAALQAAVNQTLRFFPLLSRIIPAAIAAASRHVLAAAGSPYRWAISARSRNMFGASRP